MATDNRGQVAMAMGSAVVLVLICAFAIFAVSGALMTTEEAENISHPIERNVAMAANSVGSLLPLALVVVLIGVAMWFIMSSQRAFGGFE